MATMSKAILSGSTGGAPVKVVATDITSSPTEIHAGSASSTAHLDIVTLYLYNSNTSVELVVLKIAGSADVLKFSLNPDETILALDGVPLSGHGSSAYKIEAASDTANKIMVYGSVVKVR